MPAFSISESKHSDAASQDWGYRRDVSSRTRGRTSRRGACCFIVASEGDLFGLPSCVGWEVVWNLLEAPYVTAKQRGCFSCTGGTWSRGDVGDDFSLSLLDCRVRGRRGSWGEADGTCRLCRTEGGFRRGHYPWTFCAEGDCGIDGSKILDRWVAANGARLDQVWPSICVSAVGVLVGPARGVVLGCRSTWLIPAHTDGVTILKGILIPLPASVS